MRNFLILTLIAASSFVANANDSVVQSKSTVKDAITQIEEAYNTCAGDAQSTADSNNCSSIAYTNADKELNRVYNLIRTPLVKDTDVENKEILRRLVTAQKAWITFRDADCELAGTAMLNGSGEGVIIGGCLVAKTIERVKHLQGFLGEQ
ncbi:MAG: DUF1311 domain-containing protein [Bdellovibrio sp.]|nr:DUF1311 domain-containing protein [Bdellovibrio sp.]